MSFPHHVVMLVAAFVVACQPAAAPRTEAAAAEEPWPIAGLSIARAGDAIRYLSPEGRVVASRERGTRDVVEAATGYHLNVRSAPGMGTRGGPNGEAFYVYGFAWYARWQRILPEPIVQLLEDYYSKGVEHVRAHMEQYRRVANPTHFGGILSSVAWDESLTARMERWGSQLPAAPLVFLPDSGTIDIRNERFAQALAENRVVVDLAAVDQYLASDIVKNSRYKQNPTKEDVLRVLTAPFRRPEVFSDLEKALIVAATYEGEQPLRIVIDVSSTGGFFVPDSGDKTIFIAGIDVDINLGYEGIILSKFAHEANHVLDFRNRRFLAERCWPEEDDMIETLKYLMELMWWVQRYPNDAPAWDWEPINSGLVLTYLLAANFPNSRC